MKKEELEQKYKKLLLFKIEIQRKEAKFKEKRERRSKLYAEIHNLSQDINKMKKQLMDAI